MKYEVILIQKHKCQRDTKQVPANTITGKMHNCVIKQEAKDLLSK